jgi:hypothetical protein
MAKAMLFFFRLSFPRPNQLSAFLGVLTVVENLNRQDAPRS